MANTSKQNDPTKTLAWVRENEKYEVGGRQPIFKGFVNISREQIELLLANETDDKGCVKLDIALWEDGERPGVFKGSAQPQQPRDGQQFSRPKPKTSGTPHY
ncbi:hypothetical protein A4L_22 [Anabaena phage A-4L]|uniref:Uncharacterized protein n=1 Tax=Anabaena phage A-4L TaxID=1357732 RepID=A0A059PY23_9CAUD|nr:hypothetical protein A4L_22 [Anabaena phage A-4L]AGR48549.1 hypothetical protein A4L_22 [Anabaena phage A-4L]